ncbi:MAG: hypothetical protein HBSAPP03_28120 [Phycisphaerae bacterium]|nr:MAG: hypothetical protein HBSAPP03_28120 [Phycisphaerae bacterium]
MLVTEKRPRNLSSLHAGPLLFGDWGTSRLYVLGLAFYYTAHASLYYLAVMSCIMAAVAWGYTIICRCFPEGGGVYAAARRLNPTLSVVAGTLLLCDFIVTAALSAVEGFHYFGLHAPGAIVLACIGTMVVLGVINWYGSRAAGRFALLIAVLAIAASAVIGALCIPLLPAGWRAADPSVHGVATPWQKWESLVRIVLALSGVEAVASMTGLMKQPVARTAKRTIWPVLFEVLLLNFVFCLALNAILEPARPSTPDYVQFERGGVAEDGLQLSSDLIPPPEATPEQVEALRRVKEYRATAIKLLAAETGTRTFGEATGQALGLASGIIFGLLLLSATNTAILAMVSVCYSLGQDGELPKPVTSLNYSGVPWVGLVLAVAMPSTVLLFVHDDKALGELYAIGVVGAIAINFLCCAWNRELPISKLERSGLWIMGGVMTAIELTIIVAKPHATLFAGIVVGSVLAARTVVRAAARRPAAEALPTPQAGWLAEIKAAQVNLGKPGPRVMLAARGRDNAEYAVDLARRRGAVLFAIYVRTLRVLDVQPGQAPRIENDPQAQEALGTVAVLAKQAGVPFVPIYVPSAEIAEEILDYTVTFGCDTLIMGKTRRSVFSRAIAGDVLATIASTLPEGVELITRASPATLQDFAASPSPGEKPAPPPAADDDISTPS